MKTEDTIKIEFKSYKYNWVSLCYHKRFFVDVGKFIMGCRYTSGSCSKR